MNELRERQSVIVVSGLPRSGTSLMMQMLAAGGVPILTDGVRAADIDNPRGYLEYAPVMRTKLDASWVADARGKAVKVVHLLLKDLPGAFEYRVILMQRQMEEVLASQREMLKRLRRAGADVSDERLGDLFRDQMMELDQWFARQPNFQVLRVNYLACIKGPKPVARAVKEFVGGAFVGGSLDEDKMAAVVDSSLYRKRA